VLSLPAARLRLCSLLSNSKIQDTLALRSQPDHGDDYIIREDGLMREGHSMWALRNFARLGHRVGTGTCGPPAQGPPDPVVGSALWRPGHRIMKTKLKKNLGARRQRPDSDPALTAAE